MDNPRHVHYAARTEGVPMTEAEWLAATDELRMVNFARGIASERKLRLFFRACAARVVDLTPINEPRQVLAAVEEYADGLLDGAQLSAVERACYARLSFPHRPFDGSWHQFEESAVLAACFAAGPIDAAIGTLRLAREARVCELFLRCYQLLPLRADKFLRLPKEVGQPGEVVPPDISAGFTSEYTTVVTEEMDYQLRILREIVGNPFRLNDAITRARGAWNDGVVQTIAAGAYDMRDYRSLPLLAEALEDAGCTDAELLGHLRSHGPHVRGCWALDLILSKDR
jgi:hypothetical protein